MITSIFLKDVRFYAYHGVSPQETVVGNMYVIDLRLHVDLSLAMASDDVADTVNYALVYRALKEEMSMPSRLLEHVAGRLVKRLFTDFPTIEAIDLKLAKRNPPMGADIATAGVEVHVER